MNNADFFTKEIHSAQRFCLDLNPNRKKALTVVSGGIEKCTSDYEINRKKFPYFCLEFIVAGTGILEIGGKSLKLFPGCIFSYGPDTVYKMRCIHESPMTKYFLDFAGKKSLDYLGAVQMPPGTLLRLQDPEDLADVFQSIIKYGCREEPRMQDLCLLQMEMLFKVISIGIMSCGISTSQSFSAFCRIRDAIDSKYLTFHDLKNISDSCGVEISYMCRLFKRFARESPYKYLVKIKMKHAAELLQKDGISVKSVAEKVNFSDQYFFSKTFKRIYGISPKKFAELHMHPK